MRSFFRSQALPLFSKWFPTAWGRLNSWRQTRRERAHWDERIADVVACKDNARLQRVPNAGEIQQGFQIMHNGLKVLVDGYYGEGITRMLRENRGSHEPQEEVVFDSIVRTLPAGSIMIEAGAYWGFYSMWFTSVVKEGRVYLIEPELHNLEVGKKNFGANQIQGDFTHAYVGAESGLHPDGTPVVSIESFWAGKHLERIALLHVDVQGFEIDLLKGAERQLTESLVDYVFLSSHSAELHRKCLQFLHDRQWRVLASLDMDETCSLDGIIVACGPHISPPAFDPPSRK